MCVNGSPHLSVYLNICLTFNITHHLCDIIPRFGFWLYIFTTFTLQVFCCDKESQLGQGLHYIMAALQAAPAVLMCGGFGEAECSWTKRNSGQREPCRAASLLCASHNKQGSIHLFTTIYMSCERARLGSAMALTQTRLNRRIQHDLNCSVWQLLSCVTKRVYTQSLNFS